VFIKVSRVCKHEIRRVMRHRAKRVELDPEIESNCVMDLGKFCSDGDSEKFTKGEVINTITLKLSSFKS